MRERAIVKVVKNGNSIMLTMPKPLLQSLGWRRGTRVMLEVREGCLVAAELEDAMLRRAFDRLPGLSPIAGREYGR